MIEATMCPDTGFCQQRKLVRSDAGVDTLYFASHLKSAPLKQAAVPLYQPLYDLFPCILLTKGFTIFPVYLDD